VSIELNSELAEDLIHRGFESPDLDYKQDFDDSTGAWMELAKDIYGMANCGGGFIVFGVKDGSFKPIGLDESFHKDTQDWIDRVSKWADGKISLLYFEYAKKVNGNTRKFPILCIHGSISTLIIPKTDGRYTDKNQEKIAFRQGVIYTRRNTSTAPAKGDEFWQLFWALLKRTAEKLGSQGTPLEVTSVLSKKAEPDVVEETLWFNLFPVIELPDHIFAGDAEYRFASEIYNRISDELKPEEHQRLIIPSFLLADKKIYSFSPFDETNPLCLCITGVNTAITTKQWLDDKMQHQKLVMLLNYNLKDLCRKKGFIYDVKRDRFFMLYSEGKPVPEITWKPYKSTSTRQLVYPRVDTNGHLVYCEHFAGRLRFTILGSGVYLQIEPIRVLTEDGAYPLDQNRNVRISTMKNFYYHNNNYLYDMKLWLHILAGNSKEIHLGVAPHLVTVSVLAVNAKVDFGILEDQHTSQDFLDSLRSEPFEYLVSYEETEEDNPLTETSLED